MWVWLGNFKYNSIVIKVYILQAPPNFPWLKFPGFGFVHLLVLQTNMCTNLQPWSWALICYSYELPFFVSHFCDQSVSVCHFGDRSVQKMENNWLSMIASLIETRDTLKRDMLQTWFQPKTKTCPDMKPMQTWLQNLSWALCKSSVL